LNRPIPKSAKVGALGTILIMVFAVIFLPMAAKTAQVSKKFAATLPNGTKIELLGVCGHPSTDKQWWRPDGSTVKGEGFGDFHFKNPYYVPEFDEQTRVFAINLGGRVLKDIKLTWRLTESLRSSFYTAFDDEDREKLKPVQSFVAKFPLEVQHVNLTVGIAAGKWKGVAFGGNGRTLAGTNDSLMDKSVFFHKVDQQGDTVELSATHLLGKDYDCRIVVVDTKNEIHEPAKRSNSGSDMRFCKGTFDLSPDQIKNIRLEARPYEWVEFKNISLQRGLKTDVQVESKEVGKDNQTESPWIGYDTQEGNLAPESKPQIAIDVRVFLMPQQKLLVSSFLHDE
ncbi:hypothetical protein KA005_02590, partial [bacterium]|nr:hypothetical protein [bacterium]